MAYDETLAQRIRSLLPNRAEEKRMFGGLCFMVDGHMSCGLTSEGLLVRVGPHTREELLTHPSVRPMVMGNRTMAGFLTVDTVALRTEAELDAWLRRGLEVVASLAPKTKRATRPR